MCALIVLAVCLAWQTARATSGPELDFVLNCQGCHRADGAGTPGAVPPLAGSVGKLVRASGGREFLVRVPGVAQAPLDDAALAAVLNWMLARFGRGDIPAGFVAYSAAEVRALRVKPLIDVDRMRRGLVADGSDVDD